MDLAVGSLIIITLIPAIIGGLILAWLHKLGFSLVLKTPKNDIPGFLKRFSIQLLYLLICMGAGYLYYKNVISTPISLDSVSSTSLFPPTKMGMLSAIVAGAISSLLLYVLIVTALTKVLTQFNYAESLKSQTVIIIVISVIYAALITFYYVKVLSQIPENLVNVVNEINETQTVISNNAQNKTDIQMSGVWTIDVEKSKALCAEQGDETSTAICSGGVDGAVLALMNSDGILIQGNVLQDGPNLCGLEVRNEGNFKYSCINQVDRSIYARVNPNKDGTLTFGAGMINLILKKK
jgi:uncharacterized integral membrane protein